MHFGPRLLAFAAFQKMIRGVVRQDPPGIRADAGFPRGALHIVSCHAASCPACQAHPRCLGGGAAGQPRSTPRDGLEAGGRRVWLWVFTNLRETVYEILPGRASRPPRCWGRNYAGTLGVDGWAPYRCFKEAALQTSAALPRVTGDGHARGGALPTLGQGHPPARPRLARSARCWRDQPAWPARCQGTPPGEDEPPAARPIHQSCQPAIRKTSATLSGQPLCVPRPCGRRTNYPAEQDIRIAVVNRKTCGGGNRAKGAQAQSILMSVLQSCRHKGIRVIDIVTSILRAPDNTPVPLVNPER